MAWHGYNSWWRRMGSAACVRSTSPTAAFRYGSCTDSSAACHSAQPSTWSSVILVVTASLLQQGDSAVRLKLPGFCQGLAASTG